MAGEQKIGDQQRTNTMVSTSNRMARGSKNRIIDLLRKNTTRSIVQKDGQQLQKREYRVITSGEDGMVFFWNVLASFNGNDYSKVENVDMRNPMSLLVKVNPNHVAPIRSIHDIHLTETGQIYALIVGPKMTTLVDNAGIMTYYEVKHLTPEEDAIETERERLAKIEEEEKKRAEAAAAQAAALEQQELERKR